MAEFPTFNITVTANNERLEFALGTWALVGLIDSLSGDDLAFAKLFAAASTHPSAVVRTSAARKDCLPADAVLELASDRCVDVRRTLVYTPTFQRLASEATVLKLIAGDPETAAGVAEHLNRFETANIDLVGEALLKDPDPMVRLRMASSSCTPLKFLNRLCNDVAVDVVEAARANLDAQR